MKQDETSLYYFLIGAAIVTFVLGVYIFKWYPAAKYCEKEHPDISTYICVMSNKHRLSQ